jgi:hypothetical protein
VNPNPSQPVFAPTVKSVFVQFQAFEDQSITIGYDFAVKDGMIGPCIHRFKADVCCNTFVGMDRGRLNVWLDSRLDIRRAACLGAFRGLIDEHFGGSEIDYMSFGVKKDGTCQATWYLKPYGLSHPTATECTQHS